MMKLIAIFTVLAAIPTSALAGQVSTENNSAIHCAADSLPNAFVKHVAEESQAVSAGNAAKAQ